MFKTLLLFLVIVLLTSNMLSQSILGKWRTLDETGEEKAVVELYERNGELFGKIVEIADASKRDLPCIFCKGDDYNKPILGLDIIKNMEKDGDAYKGGTITDPQNGKTYKCRLKLTEKNNVLQVRGYIAFFYDTQYWKRIKE